MLRGPCGPLNVPLTKNVFASCEIAERADAGVTGKRRNPDDHRFTCQRSQQKSAMNARVRLFTTERAVGVLKASDQWNE
jgi:hypothetical protein